ncbi:hypothetical protein SAMN05216480_101245 [Pustulibacterium marinum]|uniref:Uncharacterized protein n=1 Tax=Pustulibacterium marinum TaxID=1224947 RepID=A0A1I7EUR1_9FLAO|nr:hypothetical protein [Pustulibacterium marinum]SFU27639.1 hypothetical protein SAMN05216480_101245 [Pustulibacterium marinum]
MKKKLESELISIAHNILKLKGKEDIDALLIATQKVYEKLTVLKFVEEHFGEVQPTIGKSEVVSKFEEMAGSVMTDNKEVPESNPNEEDIVSPLMETIKGMLVEMPSDKKQETLEDILSGFASEPMFVKKDEASAESSHVIEPKEEVSIPKETPKTEEKETVSDDEIKNSDFIEPIFEPVQPKKEESKPEPVTQQKQLSLNDRVHRSGIQIGLNDRIGFVKHLFGGSNEDYNRVVSQLNTASSFQEAQHFIEHMVKPDYNNWEGKEEYEARFYTIVEKRFN